MVCFDLVGSCTALEEHSMEEDRDKERRSKDTGKRPPGTEGTGCCCYFHSKEVVLGRWDGLVVELRWQSVDSPVEES